MAHRPDRNPQARQMVDESMVRGLAGQAEAIWPQEQEIFESYGLPPEARILDLGCGTGEITSRLARRFPDASVMGVDLMPELLDLARRRYGDLEPRLSFHTGDAFELAFEDARFDLTVCRHVVQAVPEPHLIVQEMKRVTRPGGWLHILAEDYSMLYFHPVDLDTDVFWSRGPVQFAEKTGSDLRIGRKMFTHLSRLGLEDIAVRYVVVDTVRVPRETFASIWIAWRDGYSDPIAEHTEFTPEEVAAYWRTMIECIRDPHGYALWQVPVLSARVPAR